ncbi:Hypothetical predicted protein [Mytilus galloprovincialis]|uniref:Uncharacterized protein n=1 Tax=Mytilus galloprovincialis TaxID=29158 RepID=A0A8B6FA80_MYTGA|nr:Hypothetical predicted protein [Mytilus galloprovincialis]
MWTIIIGPTNTRSAKILNSKNYIKLQRIKSRKSCQNELPEGQELSPQKPTGLCYLQHVQCCNPWKKHLLVLTWR